VLKAILNRNVNVDFGSAVDIKRPGDHGLQLPTVVIC
jgi:hypothetical protein